jgi:hypothetical protein
LRVVLAVVLVEVQMKVGVGVEVDVREAAEAGVLTRVEVEQSQTLFSPEKRILWAQ